MSNGRTITIARSHFIAGCVVILVLLVAVAIYKLKSPLVPDNFSELKKVIEGEGVSFIAIFPEDGPLIPFSPDGSRINACGRIGDKGEIPESCNLKGIKPTMISTVVIIDHTKNPLCRSVYDLNGLYLYDVHRTQPNRNKTPCHDPQAGPH